jgi:hypothetical protein
MDRLIREVLDNAEALCRDTSIPADKFSVRAANLLGYLVAYIKEKSTPLPIEEWHEDITHTALWWRLPVVEPPLYCGCPLDSDWPFEEDEEEDLYWTPVICPDRGHSGAPPL